MLSAYEVTGHACQAKTVKLGAPSGDAFLRGVGAYLRSHAHGSVTAQDLWAAIGQARPRPFPPAACGRGCQITCADVPLQTLVTPVDVRLRCTNSTMLSLPVSQSQDVELLPSQASGHNVSRWMQQWTYMPGFPVLNVTLGADGKSVHVAQARRVSGSRNGSVIYRS